MDNKDFPELEKVIEIKLAPGESSEVLSLYEKGYKFVVIVFEGRAALFSDGVKSLQTIVGVVSEFGEYPVIFKNETTNYHFFARILKIRKPE